MRCVATPAAPLSCATHRVSAMKGVPDRGLAVILPVIVAIVVLVIATVARMGLTAGLLMTFATSLFAVSVPFIVTTLLAFTALPHGVGRDIQFLDRR